MHSPRNVLSKTIGNINGIGRAQRKSKLSNDRFQQIATAFYMHKLLASEGVHEHRAESLAVFC